MLQPIKRETQAIGILGTALLIAAAIGIHQFTHLNAGQWYLFAMALWMFVGWQLWRRLDLNRVSAQDALYPTLGLANHLSILRGGLIALTGGFLFQPQAAGLMAWIPGALYAIAAFLDRMDGFVARRSKHTSLLGSELDTVYDALGLLIAPLLAVGYGKIHWSFLLVSAAYYVFVWGLYWRRAHNLPVYPLIPSRLRRTLAGFQMGFVAFILLPCFHAPLTMIIGIAFMLPILLGFIVDWLIVSGRIPATATTQQAFNHLALCSHNIFQPLLRASVLIATVLFIFNSNSLSSIWVSGLLIIVVATLVGLAGRVCALALLVLITLLHGDKQIDGIITVIIFSSVWLMLLGTGRFSLWQWDDRWVNRRDGEEQS
ncbi:CDP-alcohol phosphatidyltransferase family protein [Cellvibrio sp.]